VYKIGSYHNALVASYTWPKLGKDYYPFGSSLPTRSWSDASRVYRYGFNGKEKDSETANDDYDFGARIYDARLGRWMSVDALFNHERNISQSTYCFSVNSPIIIVDKDGRLWWVAVGAIIGGGATAIKLAINGELKFDKENWKITVSKIALGAATGAAIAAFPASGFGAGGALVSSQLAASSIAAGATSAVSNLVEQGIDKHSAGEDPWDLKSYNYGSAALNGAITTITFGVGTLIGNQIASNSSKFLWTSFNKQSQLYGGLTGAVIDVSRSLVEAALDLKLKSKDKTKDESKIEVINLPSLKVRYNKKTKKSTIDKESLDKVIKVLNESKPKSIESKI
jgi:RHS repeat-associated protein